MSTSVHDHRLLFSLLCFGTTLIGAHLSAQNRTLVEHWRIEGDESEFIAPTSITLTNTCRVWLSDPTGLWQWPCVSNESRQVSRRGSGPGEYRNPALVTASSNGEQVVLWDRGLQRVSVFSDTGAFLSLKSLRVPENSFGRVIGLMADSAGTTSLVWTRRTPYVTGGADRSYVFRVDSGGAARDSVTAMEGFRSVYWNDDGLMSRHDQPLQRRPFVVFLSNGDFLVGSNDRPQVTRHSASGQQVGSIVLPLTKPGAITAADRRAYMDSSRVSMEREMQRMKYGESLKDQFRRAFDRNLPLRAEFPKTRQWYDHLLINEKRGELWVQVPGFGSRYQRTWLVVGISDGLLRERVTVPHKGTVVSATVDSDSLYAIERSRDQVPRVAKYGLPRSE